MLLFGYPDQVGTRTYLLWKDSACPKDTGWELCYDNICDESCKRTAPSHDRHEMRHMNNPSVDEAQTSRLPLPPKVPGVPLLGSTLGMLNDPLHYLIRLHQEFGPIFRVQIPGRTYTVMAGLEANQFMSRRGDEFLGSGDLFGSFAAEMGTNFFLTALDGEDHRQMRKLLRPGYSRDQVLPHFVTMIEITRRMVRQWQPGQSLALLPAVQRIVVEQLGAAVINRAPGEYFDDIFEFLNTMMYVKVMKTWPPIMLQRPAYKRARRRIDEFARLVIQEHRENPPTDRQPDVLDNVLAYRDANGQPVSEKGLIVTAIGPYFAGMDTVSNTLAFMVYALLKNPEVLEQVVAEANSLLSRDTLTQADLKDAKALYGATLETLRMYPVAAFLPRQALKPFEFGGYRVEEGDYLLMASGITHYLPQFYPEPEKFDIERYQPPRNENRKPGAFAPYGLGAHTCLGAGIAEIQLMLTTAALFQTVRLALDPPDFQARVRPLPVPSLGRRFRVKVIGFR